MTSTLPITLHLGNVDQKDRNFLVQVSALFTDPALEPVLADLRSGEAMLCYNPQTGAVLVRNFRRPASPLQVVAFVSRFSDDQWDKVVGDDPKQIKYLLNTNIQAAENLAISRLGAALPAPKQHQLGEG